MEYGDNLSKWGWRRSKTTKQNSTYVFIAICTLIGTNLTYNTLCSFMPLVYYRTRNNSDSDGPELSGEEGFHINSSLWLRCADHIRRTVENETFHRGNLLLSILFKYLPQFGRLSAPKYNCLMSWNEPDGVESCVLKRNSPKSNVSIVWKSTRRMCGIPLCSRCVTREQTVSLP